MFAPRRFPFIDPRWLRFCPPVVFAALLAAQPVSARDDADNPNRPDDLTPAERAEPAPAGPTLRSEDVTLPPFPRAENLLPIHAENADPDYSYYIDVDSVSITGDNVLLYTVIIQPARGAGNIVYEGIRCATNEVKTLAFGTRDGRFRRMPDAQWTYVHTPGAFGYRTTLVERYLCDEHGWAMDSDTVLERLVMHDPRRPRLAPKEAPSSD